MDKNLGNQVKHGLGWDLSGTLVKQISTITVTIVLARILTPEEFGIIGMAMVFISLSQVFIDVGFAQGLIQNQNNTQTIYSSVFYINIILGLVVALSIYFSAPFIGNFYENSQVTFVVQWLCLVPLIGSVGSIQNVLFVKKLDFKTLTIRTIIGTVIGGVVGVTMALFDFGVYALVGQQLTTTVFFTSILWWKSDWTPSWEFSYKEVRALFNFSGYVFLDKLLLNFFKKVDTLFIGKYFSAATLGFYSRAESLNAQVMQLTSSSLSKVLFPAFSKLQNDSKLFESSYFRVFDIATFIGILSTGSLFFLSEEIIITLLGAKWQPSVFIFQVLVFRLLLSPFGSLMGKSLLAKGFSKRKFQIGQINRLILLTPIYFGYLYGLHAFTVALMIANAVIFFINMWITHRYLNISFSRQLFSFLKPMILFIVIIFIYYFFQVEINSYLLFIAFLILQLTYSYLIKHPGMYATINLVKSLVKP